MARKKIIVLTSTFPRWPNDTDPPFVYELSRRLAADFDIHVLAPIYPGASRDEIMDGMSVHRFRYFFKYFERLAGSSGILPTLKKNKLYYLLIPFFVMAEFLSLLLLVRKIKPDVVHAHWLIPQGFVAALVGKMTGTPFVVTAHGGDVFGLQGRISGFLKRFTLENAQAITVVSTVVRRAVLAISKDLVDPLVLPMGVDATKFQADTNDNAIREKYRVQGPLLLFVGRLTEKKGVRYLLEAMPEVYKNVPDVKLLVVGAGEEEESLKNLSKNLGLANSVIFVGSIPNHDLPQFYRAADIFVGPSINAKDGDTEGFGLTFVEAGMSGCILVGSNVGGIPDIIKDGETGFLVQEKNPAAIATAVLGAINRRDEWNVIAASTRKELANMFDWPIVSEGYRKLVQAIAGS